jgi:hypothetical protein
MWRTTELSIGMSMCRACATSVATDSEMLSMDATLMADFVLVNERDM